MNFFDELKRRNVVRVGIAYVVAAWLLMQVGDIARESFEAPVWVMKMLLTSLLAGFPIVLFFSWAFEITPEGIKKEKDVDRSQSITGHTGKKLNAITIVLLVAAIALVGLDRFVFERPAAVPATPTTVTAATKLPAPVSSAASINSIAVLPFVNMSNDPDQEYFSDGIAEELLNLLVRVEGLTVASRTSAFAYKGSTASIPKIAGELKVANILEGSVRKAGNRVRITAQLIDTTNDRHLWSDSYDHDLDDIFKLQDEIAHAIVTALKSKLGLQLDANEIKVTADTGNMNAYDLYLRARGLVLARHNLPEAVALAQQAVALDPKFARAWATLGTAAYLVPSWNAAPDSEDGAFLNLAANANDRALELDPEQSQAWALKSMIGQHKQGGLSQEEGFALLNRALENDPSNATAYLWRGIRWSELGYQAQARQDLQHCLDIDPAYENCKRHLAFVLWALGETDAALELFIEGARSGFTANNALWVPTFIRSGRILAGVLASHYLVTTYPGFPMEDWLYALEHPDQDHSNAIQKALAWLAATPQTPVGVTEQLMLALGAYDLLKVDYFYVNYWLWHPAFPEFRRSRRFQQIIKEMNMPAYWDKHGLPPGCHKQGEDYICE